MASQVKTKPLAILMVEDSPSDAMLIREALADAEVPCLVHAAEDGIDAMDFLHHFGKHNQAPRPDLILLDLNLPRKGGLEVLAEVKTDNDLKSIPVVILTTSEAKDDVLAAYRRHANGYVVKPNDSVVFAETVRAIAQFWLKVAVLPPST